MKSKLDTTNLYNTSHQSNTLENIPNEEELNQLLETAITAAKKAGEIISSNMGGTEVSKLKANPRDLLTEIDPLCEQVIKETILEIFPTHDFLGEEDVDPGKDASAAALEKKLQDGKDGKSDYLWIVDPIDGKIRLYFFIVVYKIKMKHTHFSFVFSHMIPKGTSNFVHGMPLCMPSIACAYKGQTIIGVIFDPHRNEIFTAMKHHGAKMNGEPIQVGKQAVIGDAIIAMGSPPGT